MQKNDNSSKPSKDKNDITAQNKAQNRRPETRWTNQNRAITTFLNFLHSDWKMKKKENILLDSAPTSQKSKSQEKSSEYFSSK